MANLDHGDCFAVSVFQVKRERRLISNQHMTWVLGSSSIMGFGALIADTRVSWGNERHADILQKIHPVGSLLMLGFSGSVELGFTMKEDMKRFSPIPSGFVWWPRVAAWRWWRRGRAIFQRASPELQKLGCQLVLVGSSPFDFGHGYRPYCVRMRSPHFLPQFIQMAVWTSIGSGAQRSEARTIANAYRENPSSMNAAGVAEQAGGRGASAMMVASYISIQLTKNPLASVSNGLIVGIVSDRGFDIRPLRMTFSTALGGQSVSPTGLASTWEEFIVQTGLPTDMRASAIA